MYTRTYAGLLPRFFSILIGLFFTFWHPESAQVAEKMQNRRQFCQKNLFILFWPIIVCGRGSTCETHKEVSFLNGSEASGKLRYRDSQRPMRGKAHAGKTSYAYSCVHAHMRTCVYAYVRTQARMYARTHCTCIAHMSARMIFFPSVSLSMHRSTSRDTVASRMSRGTAVYRLLLIHRLLLILFARMSVRLTCAVTHVCTYEYAYWAFPAWTFPRIGLYESPPLYFEKWFKAFITATDSLSMAARKSSLAPLLTPRVTALLQSK